jgi:arginine-tRNA-protein transferase
VDALKTFHIIYDQEPPEMLVCDELVACPYLPEHQARMPLRLPIRALKRHEWDTRLRAGDRRHGAVLYRPGCPTCEACTPIRIPVERFQLSRNQRRVLRRAERQVEVEMGPTTLDVRRLDLYEAHLVGRGLETADHSPMTPPRYQSFLVESCCETFELRYHIEDQLVGLAVTDRAEESLSAHYTFYDVRYGSLSLGTFSVLRQIELCRQWGLEYLYLGLYVADNAAMEYKARFRPHQRLLDGRWQDFQ